MKLKLSEQNDVQILTVTEDIPQQQAVILRAGFSKIASTGKKKMVLDLSQATSIAAESLIEILSLSKLAEDSGMTLIIVSKNQEISPTSNLAEALAAFQNELAKVWHEHGSLAYKLANIRKLTQDAKNRLAKVDLKSVHRVRKEHSQVVHLISELESQIKAAIENARVKTAPLEYDVKYKTIESIADQALSLKGAWVTDRV